MKVFAVSDVHVDYDVNARWIDGLSLSDYRDDVLILAGDISDSMALLERSFTALARRFHQVLFVPGNHDLWVRRDPPTMASLDKFDAIRALAENCGLSMQPWRRDGLAIVPMMSWYDFSFGRPGDDLEDLWMDFRACRWPDGWTPAEITSHFLAMNTHVRQDDDRMLISFSHFLPRIDVFPSGVPDHVRMLFPIMGAARLDAQVRALRSDIHVYGHSHLNRRLRREGTLYVNNAFAYPKETRIAAKALVVVHETA